MSESQVGEKAAAKTSGVADAESPTTAQPLEFEDEPQESAETGHALAKSASTATPKVATVEDETPPAKPPRPNQQADTETTLIEAFPSVEPKVIKAVLVASGGQIEPAFNALLSMSDPDFQVESVPAAQSRARKEPKSQLHSDEVYARQLAAHYQQSAAHSGAGSRTRGEQSAPRPKVPSRQTLHDPYDDKEHSFFDDDLPVIRENVRIGLLETQSKVNKWISDFKKRLDGDETYGEPAPQTISRRRQDYGPSESEQIHRIRRDAENSRRSTDRNRYDSDPRLLDDNFTALELRDDEVAPAKPPRPLANPDLFKPIPTAPQFGPVDEVEAVNNSRGDGLSRPKKWQPITSVTQNPEPENNDPFSLGDSDDEQEIKSKEAKADKAVNEATTSPAKGQKLASAPRSGNSGTRDKTADILLTGLKSPGL